MPSPGWSGRYACMLVGQTLTQERWLAWKVPSSSQGSCQVMSSHSTMPKENTSPALVYSCAHARMPLSTAVEQIRPGALEPAGN